MRSSVEVLGRPFAFWQLRPLNEQSFIKEARTRGVQLRKEHLESLHRLKLLVPIFRVKRDGRAIAAAARSRNPAWPAYEMAHWSHTDPRDLTTVKQEGRLFDPCLEPFISRARLQRQVGDLTYESSEYLYSHHQLLAFQWLGASIYQLPHPDWIKTPKTLTKDAIAQLRSVSPEFHELVMTLSVLEPLAYPEVIGRIRYRDANEFETYTEWRDSPRAGSVHRWLGVDCDWIRDQAQVLLQRADWIDDLGDWAGLIREADSKAWEKLKGNPRLTMDLRIGAEILLRYFERVRPSQKSTVRQGDVWKTDFANRLLPDRKLHTKLNKFGLSPTPRVVLVVEGHTEDLIFPRVMSKFGVRLSPEFIRIVNAKGVGTDLSSLISYAIAPIVEEEPGGGYLSLVRPPTQLLVVTDPEGRYVSSESRDDVREKWVDHIMDSFDPKYQNHHVRKSVGSLLQIEPWDNCGSSFEFAHFTDRQLAVALERLDTRDRRPTLAKLIPAVGRVRSNKGNLKTVVPSLPKRRLAEELWPVLSTKIDRARLSKTEDRIPIVRVLDRALELAHRSNVQFVIPLSDD